MTQRRLAHSHSAYLAQHADNPVDGWEWSPEAFAEAARRDVPVFVSVGYAACHWCHVMAHESFEDDATAALMNENFVCIKVDREERPDVDAIYMAATIALSGHGGWPMSVFTTPDGKPFMAGTYYPPQDRGSMPSFSRVLRAMSDGWNQQRQLVLEQAEKVGDAVAREIGVVDRLTTGAVVREDALPRLRDALIASADAEGGFSGAPKFPRPSYVRALFHDPRPSAERAWRNTLAAMSRRGLYDHIDGGFARYSVDAQWHVPHFEKMLSDQALLAHCYFQADQVDGGDSEWGQVARDTIDAVLRRFETGSGLASSLDADAGGHEGLHVTWTLDEVREALTLHGLSHMILPTLERYSFDISVEFEGRLIPTLAPSAPFAATGVHDGVREALRDYRQGRPAPGRDDKVVLEYNAMFLVALFASPDEEHHREAQRRLEALSVSHYSEGSWWRTGSHTIRANALDVAWLADAYLAGAQRCGSAHYVERASELLNYLVTYFWDGPLPQHGEPSRGGGFFSVDERVSDIPWRPKDLFDGATPSSHSVATRVFALHSVITGDESSRLIAERLAELAQSVLNEHPSAVPDLVDAVGYLHHPVEIVVPGTPPSWWDGLASTFVRNAIVVTEGLSSPLLEARPEGRVYVCRHNTCQLPATSRETMLEQLGAFAS